MRQDNFAIYEDKDIFTETDPICKQADLPYLATQFSAIARKFRTKSSRIIFSAYRSRCEFNLEFLDSSSLKLDNTKHEKSRNIFAIQQTWQMASFQFCMKDTTASASAIACECFFMGPEGSIILYNRGKHSVTISTASGIGELAVLGSEESYALKPQDIQLQSGHLVADLSILPRTWECIQPKRSRTDDNDKLGTTHKRYITNNRVLPTSKSQNIAPALLAPSKRPSITNLLTSKELTIRPKERIPGEKYSPKDYYTLSSVSQGSYSQGSAVSTVSRHSANGLCIVKTFTSRESRSIKHSQAFIRDIKYSRLAVHPFILALKGYDARLLLTFTAPAEQILINAIDDDRLFENPGAFAKIFFSIALALNFLHNTAKLKHQNVNTSAIVLTGDSYKLTDLHFADRISDSNKYNEGVIWYIPPEFDIQEDAVTELGDIYSFAVILLYVLRIIPLPEDDETGRSFSYNLTHDSEKRIAWRRELRHLSDQGLDLAIPGQRIITNMLARDPKHRITALEIILQLRRAYPGTWRELHQNHCNKLDENFDTQSGTILKATESVSDLDDIGSCSAENDQ